MGGLQIRVERAKVASTRLTSSEFLRSVRLDTDWQEVRAPSGEDIRVFEQKGTLPYNQRIERILKALVDDVSSRVWSTCILPRLTDASTCILWTTGGGPARSVFDLRRHVLLGSVTRYRPHQFERIAQGSFGPHIQEIIATVPSQFLYIMASRFAKRDVTRPAVI